MGKALFNAHKGVYTITLRSLRFMSLTSEPKRHIIFFGETGVGKSSAINLLLDNDTPIQASNVPAPRTQVNASYETILNGMKYTLWDTRGLGEASCGFLQNIFGFGAGSEKELRKFLNERHAKHEFDLLVYCVHGSRATPALAKYYHRFCAIARRLVAPVAILVTHLESEPDMENWWRKNSSRLRRLKMEFDDHACITTIPKHAQAAESKKRLADLITKKPLWEVQRTGSFFGLQVQMAVTPFAPRCKFARTLLKFKSKSLDHRKPESWPSIPVVEYSPPRGMPTESPNVSKSDIDLPRVNKPLQSLEETPRTSYSLFSSGTSTLYAGVYLQSCAEENEDHPMNELPLKNSIGTVVRRKAYATLHGPFGDVWECDLIRGESFPSMVAVKAVKLRRNGFNDLRSHEKKLREELRVWETLQHQNIVPLLGIVSDFGPLPSMVSPWFPNGSMSRYLENHLMSISEKRGLVKDIASGLSYLHGRNIVHGDLHSDNVLIDDGGRACLTDFVLSFSVEIVGTSYLKSSIYGGVQFADPALVRGVQNSSGLFSPTQPCDVYSFGGLMLHALSQKKPYNGLSTGDILRKILAGERPDIPTHDSINSLDESLIRKCWDREEHNRPLVDDLVVMLN